MNQLQTIDNSKLQLLKDTLCKGSTDDEFEQFVTICNRTKLDPFTRQIYAIKRWNSKLGREEMTTQTSIDGFRVVAERSDKYSGQLGPFWCGQDGIWYDVWLKPEPPAAAKVGIMRNDFKEPLWSVAVFKSYAQKTKDGKLTQFWSKMPELMIAKVAESLALRKAFPQDLSGLYTNEEMPQEVDEPKEVTPIKTLEPKIEEPKKVETKKEIKNHADNIPATLGQFQKMKEFREILGLQINHIESACALLFGLDNPRKMTLKNADVLLSALEKSKNAEDFGLEIQKLLD